MSDKYPISRRSVLRGLGAALTLPTLEAMTANSAVAASTAAAPKRMAFFFVPNGVIMEDWKPDRTDTDFDWPKTLEPLKPLKNELNVISGLTQNHANANGDGAGDHARSAATFLTGQQARKTSGKDIHAGVSADQFAAQQIGDKTPFPTLELGLERGRLAGNCDSGYSCAYSNAISWRTPSSPVAKEINPRAVFERLFGDSVVDPRKAAEQRKRAFKESILDYVRQDAEALNRKLGRTDQRKLDEYLYAVRQIEKRLQEAEKNEPKQKLPKVPKPSGIPGKFADHARLMVDMLALAFQTDTTRIATFMIANEGSNRSYREIGVPRGHHSLSHHGGDRDKINDIAKINHLHMEQFAYFLTKLRDMKEVDGTSVLDNSMIAYGCAISDGNRHRHSDLPCVLAGKGGGSIKTGRHISVRRVPMCNLFLSMFDQLGVKADQFGDSTGRLRELV